MTKALAEIIKRGNQDDLSNMIEKIRKRQLGDNPVLSRAKTQYAVTTICSGKH